MGTSDLQSVGHKYGGLLDLQPAFCIAGVVGTSNLWPVGRKSTGNLGLHLGSEVYMCVCGEGSLVGLNPKPMDSDVVSE